MNRAAAGPQSGPEKTLSQMKAATAVWTEIFVHRFTTRQIRRPARIRPSALKTAAGACSRSKAPQPTSRDAPARTKTGQRCARSRTCRSVTRPRCLIHTTPNQGRPVVKTMATTACNQVVSGLLNGINSR